jgi:hypothetical protein
MADSTSSSLAILFGLGVFLLIVAIGWRSVQNRRILRLQGINGHETIIVACEDDDISSVVTTTETTQAASSPAPAPSVVVVDTGLAEAPPPTGLGRSSAESETAMELKADASGRDRLSRVVSSGK